MQECSSQDCLTSKGIRRFKTTDRFYCSQHYHDTLLLEALANGHMFFVSLDVSVTCLKKICSNSTSTWNQESVRTVRGPAHWR